MRIVSLKVLKESGKKKLHLLPHVFTFANAIFGFLAVIKTLDYEFVAAAQFIVLAVVMDFLDGRLARALNTSSSLGMELDSLSDAISFCFAPAVLWYSWFFWPMRLPGIFVLTIYLCAGLFRLARFNVLSERKEKRGFFVGLPTTSAAFFLALLVLNANWISASPFNFLFHPLGALSIFMVLALLMVSPVPFATFKRISVAPRLVFGFGVVIFAGGLYALAHGVPVFFLGISCYIVASVALYFVEVVRSF